MAKIKKIRRNNASLLKAKRVFEQQLQAIDQDLLDQVDGLCQAEKYVDAVTLLEDLLLKFTNSPLLL